MSYVICLPSVWQPYREACVATLAPEAREYLCVVNNEAPGANLGVPASWNVGRQVALDTGADWLVVLSAAVRFGPAGGMDFLTALAGYDPDETWAVEANRGSDGVAFGWHLIAFSRLTLTTVGDFDPVFSLAYMEDIDYAYRIHIAARARHGAYPIGDFRATRAGEWPPWPKIEYVDGHVESAAHGICLAHVHVDFVEHENRYVDKWGSSTGPWNPVTGKGCELWTRPYNDNRLDFTYTGAPPREPAVSDMVRVPINGRWQLFVPRHLVEWGGTGQEWEMFYLWERERMASMADVLRPGDLLMEVGSEQGWMSAACAQLVGGRNMILIEPSPPVWPNIRATWRANALELPAACWVGLMSDDTDLHPPYLNVDPALDGDGWPVCSHGPIITHTAYRNVEDFAVQTPRSTIDDWCATRQLWPTALTIDVEGAELRVLKGARRLLGEHDPVVWVSVHPEIMRDRCGQDPSEIGPLMASYGYLGELLAVDHEEHWLYRKAPA